MDFYIVLSSQPYPVKIKCYQERITVSIERPKSVCQFEGSFHHEV